MNKDILAQKEADVIALTEKMEAASSVVLVEYRGLSVKEVTELRRALREEDVEFKVYRNAIARRAAEKLGHEDFAKTLVGPNALAFGIVDGAMVDEATIQKLSALPNKEGMLAKFASCLNAPVIKFAMTVKALAEAKENGSVKTEEAPATEEAAA